MQLDGYTSGREQLLLAANSSFVLWLPFHVPDILGLFAGWGPGLAAVIVTGALSGKAGVKNLFRRYLIWRVNIGWYLLALFGTAGFILGGIGLYTTISYPLSWPSC
jgi:hypothetical protein